VGSKLSFSDHITEKVNKVYSILGIIKRNFQHVDKVAFVLLYKALVRSHLEYGNTVWSVMSALEVFLNDMNALYIFTFYLLTYLLISNI